MLSTSSTSGAKIRRTSDTLPSKLLAFLFGRGTSDQPTHSQPPAAVIPSPSKTTITTSKLYASFTIADLFNPIPDSLMPAMVESEDDETTEQPLLEMEEEESFLASEEEETDYEADDEAEPKRSVAFYDHVKVKEIPSHRAYTNEMRRNMWNSLDTINRNLERNTIEFLVDGWSWQHATEEQDFLESKTGERVHPATWMRENNHGRSSGNSMVTSTNKQHLLGNKRLNLEEMISRAPELMRRHQNLSARCY